MLKVLCNAIDNYRDVSKGILEIMNIMHSDIGYFRVIPRERRKRNSNRKKNKKTNYKRKKSK